MPPVPPLPASLSLVIPCYNEATRVPLMMGGLDNFLNAHDKSVEVIIVDDGSRDDTHAIIEAHPVFQTNQSRMRVVRQANTGKGGALANGVSVAGGDYILTLDADMATPPAELHNWLNLLDGNWPADTVLIGSREHTKSVIRKEGDRKLAGNIFNQVIRAATPLKRLRDTQCGFKLYPGPAARAIFAKLRTPGWAHDVEILWRAQNAGLDIREMPITWRAVEGSKINVVADGIRMFREVLSIRGLLRRENKKASS